MESSMLGPLPVCSSMIVSVRWPTSPTPPVPRRLLSARDSPLRLSDPTRRYVEPGCSAGLAPPGSASTLSILLHAQSGTATRNTIHATRTSRMILPIGRLRRVLALGGGTGWAGSAGRGAGRPSPPRDVVVGGASGRSIRGSILVGSGSSEPAGWSVDDFWPP